MIGAGLAAVGAGMAGLFLPLLPTTPFLLLALFCFARSSDRLHRWLLSHRIFGAHLTSYLKFRAVSLPIKVLAIAFLWCSLAVSMILIDNPYARAALLVVGIAVSIHLLALRILKNGSNDMRRGGDKPPVVTEKTSQHQHAIKEKK